LFIKAKCSSCHPTISIKALKKYKALTMTNDDQCKTYNMFWTAGEQNGQAGFRDGLAVKGLA